MSGEERTTSGFATYRAGGTTPDIALMVRLILTVRAVRGQLDERLRRIGQSASRMETLAAILNMPDPKSQSDVARRLRLEGATVTRMIDVLSREGLVKRAPDPADRRVNLLSITPEGEAALEEIFAVYDNLRDHVLADLDPAERAMMHDLLGRIIARVDAPQEDAGE
ncbi:MarR family winged helix-turn-helix transcriptional regulator [Alteraurantiacibacter palmitatis]|uniref:MarR family winged helix-turn-helix transcriptional regulator n=1 Tax=Alteraurantiacibacter palmitatis TaxID=2054628 RepID=A0ABV7E9R4_9SPHN